ncbi:MAG: hypothetical protein ACRDOI_40295 [Trebonia sp.]
MASDRGTMTRGAGAGQQAPWGEATAPAGRRMPGAPRERRPVLAVLAVLLVVGGALAAGALVVKSGQRVGAVEVVQSVPQGEQIPANAIQEVQISADSGVNYVSWQFAGQIAQYLAAMPIPKGTLLNNGMLTKTSALPNDEAEVGLALKDGQIPGNLKPGDTIDVYSTASTSGGCPGKPGTPLATSASVVSVSVSTASANMTDVVVAMGTESVGAVVCNTANGSAGIAVVPRNGAS